MSFTRALLLAALTLILIAVPVFAQIDKAAIDAVAIDQGHAPLPGVTVTISRPAVGFTQVLTTDTAGIAHFNSLNPGTYTVEFALEGFAPVKQAGIALVVGQSARLGATMLAKTSETITVTAASPVVDVHKTDSSTNIVPEQIDSLPVPDRDFQRLTFLAPGVERERGAFRFVTGGPVIGAGGNASQATILVDGVDFTDPALGLSRTRFSQDAIREFRVIQNRFDSEIGGSSGGALSIVTKSGTNDLSGNVFGFYRSKSLRAKGPLDLKKNDYSRHQFGGTLGGPIMKDKLFFFGSVEQVSEDNVTLFRPGGAYASRAEDVKHPFDQTLLFGSLDGQISSKASTRFGLVYEKYKEDNFRVGGVADASYGQTLNRKNWNATFQHTFVVSATSNNEFHGQYGSHDYEEPTNSTAVAEWYSSGNTLQTGGNILGDLLGRGTTWELRDTWYQHINAGKSSHDLKAGISAQHVNERSRIDTYAYGLFLYVTDTKALPLAYAYGVGSADVKTSTNIYGGYIEDAWHPTTKLLVNMGLRYDVDTDGNNAGFTHPLFSGARKKDSNNWQPRASFSYDLEGDGRNVLRGGAGRFTGRFLLVPALQELQQNGVTGRVTYTRINGALFGIPALALDPAHPTTTGIVSKPAIILLAPDYHAPESDQFSLGWTTRLGESRMYLDTEGIYVKGREEIVIRDTNWSGNATHVRPNTTYDQINMYTNDGHSKYQAFVVGLNGNIRQNDLITASATFANKRNISDDFSPEFPTGYPNDPANIEAEYGRSRGTERYRFVLSGIFHAPWNVTVAPILEYGSGQPWTHRLGYDFNGDGKNSDRPAGVGRFTMDGPLYRSISLRVTKAIPAGGMGNLEVIAEAFNLTNYKNYDVASINGGEFLSGPTIANPGAAAVKNPNYGKPTSALAPREIQLGLRWVF
jgi:hypothetical protein